MANAVKTKPDASTDTPHDLWSQGLRETYGNYPDTKLQRGESPGNIRSDKPQNNSGGNNGISGAVGKAGKVAGALGAANQAVHDPAQAAKSGAQALARKAIIYGARVAAKALDAYTAGLASLVERPLENPHVRRFFLIAAIVSIFVVLGFIICAAVVIFIVVGGGYTVTKQNQDNQTNNQQQNTLNLTVTKDAPGSVANGANIDYKISYAFPLSAQDLTITDHLPSNVTYASSPATVKYDKATNTLVWKRSENQPPATGGQFTADQLTGSFTFTVKPTQNDTYVYNLVTGEITGASQTGGTTTGGSNAAATADDCNGAYKDMIARNSAIGTFEFKSKANFGDPKCSFTNYSQSATDPHVLDNLYKHIQDALTQTNSPADDINTWKSILPCESNYNANNFNPDSFNKYENPPGSGNYIKMGAYGLFQMNPPYEPERDGSFHLDPNTKQPVPAGNTQYDNGGVDWETQVINAINQNKVIHCKWSYWGCAPSSLTQNVCIDPATNKPRSPGQ